MTNTTQQIDDTTAEIITREVIDIDDVIVSRNTSGLGNVGMTCYINTAIQCLGFCSEFLKFILDGKRAKPQTPITDELKDVYTELWIRGNAIAPHRFLRSLHYAIGNKINILEQNDISEFLMIYLDKLNTDLGVELDIDDKALTKIKKQSSKFKNVKLNNLAHDMNIAWINAIKKEYSPIMDLFHGQQVSQIICGNCKHIHHNYEIYNSINLPLKNKEAHTIEEAIADFFTKEVLNKNEKEWVCDRCESASPSHKCIRLWKNPRILIINLKRFDHNLTKNRTEVQGCHLLNLDSYCIQKDGGNQYNLVAISHHQGGLGSGHYNALCRHKNNKWFAVDDEIVREAQANDVDYVMKNGYIYFYELVV
jgi:ubiquitin C-terminal hydrolase